MLSEINLLPMLEEFQDKARFSKNELIVCGCSTSEVLGNIIGSTSNSDVANKILDALLSWGEKHSVYIAIQGCEHINRALVVEREVAQQLNLQEVNVKPVKEAGGALSEAAMEKYKDSVVVEDLQHKASGGIDIGDTFIGMHLHPVVVPVRISKNELGKAHITFARTRLKLIGGSRAKYFEESIKKYRGVV